MNDNNPRPYNHFVQNEKAYCPKCGRFLMHRELMRRKLCQNSVYRWWNKCPDVDHFHHSCRYCGAKWSELTMEVYHTEVKLALRSVLSLIKKSDLTPDQITEVVTESLFKDVMES